MSKKILLTLKDDQLAALEEVMKDRLLSNRTAFFITLLGEEVARHRAMKNRKGPGRPKKDTETSSEDDVDEDYTDDLPKNVLWMGSMIGPREHADILERHKALRG